MAKRKTKKQKSMIVKRRTEKLMAVESVVTKDRSLQLDYEQKLLSSDLIKTVVVSVVVLALELVIYFKLN